MARRQTVVLDAIPRQYRDAEITDNGKGDQIEKWLSSTNLLTLYGEAGTGKTRMLWALYKRLAIERAQISRDDFGYITIEGVEIFSLPILLKRLQALCGESMAKEMAEIERLCSRVTHLLLDDLGTEKTTDFALAELSLIICEREQWNRPTIISTNLTLREIDDYFGNRIASRIQGGTMIKFSGNDRRLERK